MNDVQVLHGSPVSLQFEGMWDTPDGDVYLKATPREIGSNPTQCCGDHTP